jgi:group I intron endonuclease
MSMVIYTLTNIVNGKQYVGKTMVTAMKRFQQHKADARKGSETAIHRAIRKYTPEAFLIETVDEAADKATLNQKEREWIVKLNTLETGYNMTPGGEGQGHKHSEETKQKLRDRRLAYFQENPKARTQAAEYGRLAKMSEEEKERRRVRMTGNQLSKGITYQHTVEAKAAISKAHKGKVVLDETIAKFRAARIGKGTGERNAMADPMNRAKVAASKIGRKKMYREDGTAYMGYPSNLNTHSESPS